MADKRISELTELVLPNAGTDVLAVVDTSTNKTKRATPKKLPMSDSAINHSYKYTTDIISGTIRTRNLTSISETNGSYTNDTNLTSIYMGGAVTSLGTKAFQGCTSLSEVVLPPNITSIGNYAFKNCTSLTSITIPERVNTIGSDAFYNCNGLTTITIPDTVRRIGATAFTDCSSLTSITIPNSVTSISFGAFSRCTSITTATIGSSVGLIGQGCFQNCTSLARVDCLAKIAPHLQSNNHFDNVLATEIHVPFGAKASYQNPFDEYANPLAGDGITYAGLIIIDDL
tara:strand:+ start:1017 stop:1874 length:858 start_codon:yes stop_codon:yes gene_type:complete